MEKTCNKCGRTLPIEMFAKRLGSSKDGYYTACKQCTSDRKRKWREDNPDYTAKYYNKAKDKLKPLSKTAIRRQYIKDHPELNPNEYITRCNLEQAMLRYHQVKSDPIAKSKYNEQLKARIKKYYSNPSNKLAASCSRWINVSIKKNRSYRHSAELIGCSINDLRIYIESLWLPGMTWDNWSVNGWHIDHIIPITAFDLTDTEQQKQCFHYTNLQPLWAEDNIRKSNKILEQQLKLI